jgi:cysteinyl-tRNA synthetase
MEAGARVDVAPYKRSPLDFVLWKPSKPGEPSWPSPAGIATPGRPGWHIECSAMSWKHLGEVFDVHAGGIDLVFPHHENEIAQSRCCFGTPTMANVWMHNGFLQVEGEKMSKSLGNFVTINELLATDRFGGRSWPGEVLRLAMLRTHYRQPIDWTVRALEEAERTLASWTAFPGFMTGSDEELAPSVREALLDDLNTPRAIAELHELDSRGNFALLGPTLRALGFRTGGGRRASVDPKVAAQVSPLIAARSAARAAKNWAESDRIRDKLAAMGIALKDNKDGTTTWEVAR